MCLKSTGMIPAIENVPSWVLYTVIAVETVCIIGLGIANFRLLRTVRKLRETLRKLRRSSYDVYLLQNEFKHIVNQTLRLIVTKMKAHALRNSLSFTSEVYLQYKTLFIDEVIAHIKTSRLYELLVSDVFGSEKALRSYLEGIFELETIDIYLSDVHEG